MAKKIQHQVDQSVCVGSFLEKNHKYQAYCQGVGYIRQKIDGLIKFFQRFDGA